MRRVGSRYGGVRQKSWRALIAPLVRSTGGRPRGPNMITWTTQFAKVPRALLAPQSPPVASKTTPANRLLACQDLWRTPPYSTESTSSTEYLSFGSSHGHVLVKPWVAGGVDAKKRCSTPLLLLVSIMARNDPATHVRHQPARL